MVDPWDEEKRLVNLAKHGYDFDADAEAFDWRSALLYRDTRYPYGETRITAVGYIEGRLCSMTYTVRGGVKRIISLRRASKKERRRYGQTHGKDPA